MRLVTALRLDELGDVSFSSRIAAAARKISISTPKGPHQVWIKRVGNNPKLKLLLLTGGPGLSHAYLEVMDSYLPAES